MADPEPHSLASTFPNPPPFWRDFTPDKLARVDELRRAAGVDADAPLRLPSVPDDLAVLQPPPEPADGCWRVFGDQYMLDDRLPTLEEQGITNLPASAPARPRAAKHYDGALELKRLAKSLLLNFLELASTLARSLRDAEAKMGDVRTLFINIHHALNEYRPHQARESAMELMQDHLDRTRAETLAVRAQINRARSVLEGLGSLGLAVLVPGERRGEEAHADEVAGSRDRELWSATYAVT